MVRSYEATLKPLARELRSRMTDAEQWLWQRLRRKLILGVQFYRQKPIGSYIVDFYAPAAHLLIEIDGGQHYEADHAAHDRERDLYLARLGLQILRFDNLQVLQQGPAVLDVIWSAVHDRLAQKPKNPPNPPLRKGGEA